MRKTDFLCFFILGLGVAVLIASFQSAPGYMDADYYYAGGLRLATGHGFTEPFIWNFLNDPTGLPVPSHTYWMPLASLLAVVGMVITGVDHFTTARLGFILLYGCIPPLAVALAYSLNPNRKMALLAGLLALLPGFYLPFLTTTDTFSLQMVLGGLFLLVALRMPPSLNPICLGLLAGLMHLSRVDGILWLFIALLFVCFYRKPTVSSNNYPFILLVSRIGLCLLGYLLIMTPWFLRNNHLFGSIFPPGSGRAIWLTNYDELYSYPAALLTSSRWWASGFKAILLDRLIALSQNIQTAVAVQGQIFLLPLIIIGVWRLRNELIIKMGVVAYLLILFLMTVIFPYAGGRGGFFHSGSALQILIWALAPLGLESIVKNGSRLRSWSPAQAFNVLGTGLVGLAAMFTVVTTYPKMIGSSSISAWGESENAYTRLDRELVALGANPQDVVLVNNPPGYFVTTGRMAVVIPDGNIDNLLAVAHRYHANYLLLEVNHPTDLDDLYLNPSSQPALQYILSSEDTHIFILK